MLRSLCLQCPSPKLCRLVSVCSWAVGTTKFPGKFPRLVGPPAQHPAQCLSPQPPPQGACSRPGPEHTSPVPVLGTVRTPWHQQLEKEEPEWLPQMSERNLGQELNSWRKESLGPQEIKHERFTKGEKEDLSRGEGGRHPNSRAKGSRFPKAKHCQCLS